MAKVSLAKSGKNMKTVDSSQAAVRLRPVMQGTYDGPPKLIVFGGNGFVGTRVCEEALNTGLAVVSISRSATPKASAHWTSQVDWVSVSPCLGFNPGCYVSHTNE